ncbi:TPA: hypothetical protein ACH3X2_012196 [Trebouxia sp. C0005]
MRQLTALLPQHEKPWSHALAEQSAFTSYGTSTAAAIVACVIFFLFLSGAAANSFYTKYLMYEVLCAATAFRTVAFGVRAAYTVHYRPALEGVWLAFNNAGFGANVATLSLVLGTWLNKVGHVYFGKWERRFYTAWAYLLVLSVVIFGLTCGVTAAGLAFGAYTDYAASYGERLRTAASYGLASAVFGLLTLSIRISISVLITQRSKSGYVAATEEHPARQPKLVVLFVICACFLAIRGATGVVAIYIPYEEYWVDDVRFYLLDTLPEYLVLIIMVWPAMLARMGQIWPKATKGKDKDRGNETGKDGGNGQGKDGGYSRYTGSNHGQQGIDSEASVLDSAAEMPAGSSETILDVTGNDTVHK